MRDRGSQIHFQGIIARHDIFCKQIIYKYRFYNATRQDMDSFPTFSIETLDQLFKILFK